VSTVAREVMVQEHYQNMSLYCNVEDDGTGDDGTGALLHESLSY
jgi:hypothetical protein